MTEIFDNINKMYTFRKPCETLASFIEFFSESYGENTDHAQYVRPFSVKLFPSYTPTIWLNLGSPYQLHAHGKLYTIKKREDILLLRNETVTRQNLTADHIFTIKFFPGGMEDILGISQTVLAGRVVHVSDIMPAVFIEQIKKRDSFEDRVAMLETFLLQQLQKRLVKDHYIKIVKDSIGVYTAGGMNYHTSEVAEKMFITSKTINRYFHRVVGTSPKKYFSIIRARKALLHYHSNKKLFNASEHGYYDISHFYKEVIDFTGAPVTGH